jgi:hypothetical protein
VELELGLEGISVEVVQCIPKGLALIGMFAVELACAMFKMLGSDQREAHDSSASRAFIKTSVFLVAVRSTSL